MTSSTCFVKYLTKTKYDSYMFALIGYDKNDENMNKFIKEYENKKYVYLKEKVLSKMGNINLENLEDYLDSEKNLALKLYFDSFEKNGKTIDFVGKVSNKRSDKYLKQLHLAILDDKRKFMDTMVKTEYESDSE